MDMGEGRRRHCIDCGVDVLVSARRDLARGYGVEEV